MNDSELLAAYKEELDLSKAEVQKLSRKNIKIQQERDDAVKKYENMKYRILHMFGSDEQK